MENKKISPEELAFRTGHYPTFSMALAMAMTRCFAWRFVDTGEDYSAVQLFDFAQKFDASYQDDGRSFFMVSGEGAIGVSPGMEYQTKWLFIPLPASPERDAILEKMKADIAAVKAETPKEPGV
jgi:hypothetical protein